MIDDNPDSTPERTPDDETSGDRADEQPADESRPGSPEEPEQVSLAEAEHPEDR